MKTPSTIPVMTLFDPDEAIIVHPAHLSLTAHVKSLLEFMLGNIADNKRLSKKFARLELIKITPK